MMLRSVSRRVALRTIQARSYGVSPEQEEAQRVINAQLRLEDHIGDVLRAPTSTESRAKLEMLYDQVKADPKNLATLLRLAAKAGPVLKLDNIDFSGSFKKEPVRVAVTGAAGQIGYALLTRIISGQMLGVDQPVILHLLERPEVLKALEGVVMELQDCASPLLYGVVPTSDINKAFDQIDYALLVGAKPRGPGMERADVLKDNAKIFSEQGKALAANAKSTCLTLVVGNPANTNALIAASNAAAKIPAANFSAMTRLDQNRAMAQLALKTNSTIGDIDKVCIWGNHSATQYPDISFATVRGKPAFEAIQKDEQWFRTVFIPTVQNRGAEIIKARGVSSAASAADAAIKHMHDWALGSNTWASMAVPTDGSYGIAKGVYSSFPVMCAGDGKYQIVKDLKHDAFSSEKVAASVKELLAERDAVKALLP